MINCFELFKNSVFSFRLEEIIISKSELLIYNLVTTYNNMYCNFRKS